MGHCAEVTVFKMRFDNQILQVPGITPPTFQNIGATDHKGVESALEYHFAEDGALAGLELYANYTWTKAIQQSGDNRGLDVPSTRATLTAWAPATRWPAGLQCLQHPPERPVLRCRQHLGRNRRCARGSRAGRAPVERAGGLAGAGPG